MSLSYVTLTGTLGTVATGAIAVFTPAGWLADPTDQLLIPPASQRIVLASNGTFSVPLLATDNANTPDGWTWMVTISGILTVPSYSFSFLLPHANGATQDISALAETPAVTPTQAYLPLPSGTPSAGQVPVATGSGEASAWGSVAPGGSAGGVLSGTYPNPGFATTPLPESGGTMTGWLAPAVVALSFVGSGTTLVNAAAGNVFALTLTASTTTLGNPSNPVDGQAIRVRVIQGSGGSFTLAYGSAYDFGAAGAPTLSTTAAKVDILGFEYVASLTKWCFLGSGLGF